MKLNQEIVGALVVPVSIILLSIITYLDVILPTELTLLFFYVVLVGLVAALKGGLYAYFYAAAAGLARTVAQEIDQPSNGLNFYAAWMFLNCTLANFIVTYIIIKKDNILSELRESSLTDPLTKLPNRRAFKERLNIGIAHSRRFGEQLSVAYIDVDGFKKINDTYGHNHGDKLLIIISDTIKHQLRADDLGARLGGDEFAIIYMHASLESDTLIPRIKEALDVTVKEHKFDVSFSIGIINYFGDRDVDSEELINSADRLMYEVKKSSKNGILISNYEYRGLPT